MWYEDAEAFKLSAGHEVDGVWYPRVTTILQIKAKPALDRFFAEMSSYEAAEEVRNKSAEEGSRVHEIAQKLLVGEPVSVPLDLAPAMEELATFQHERAMQFYPEYIERQIWSRAHRYAGTVDALVAIDGKFGILDIKTSPGFYPEYNLQTAAYVTALKEFHIKQALGLTREIETRWILRVNQHRRCQQCTAILREKGGRVKVRNGKSQRKSSCEDSEHDWGPAEGDIELREFPYYYRDAKAFLAAKTLWEWENNYWLRQIGYVT